LEKAKEEPKKCLNPKEDEKLSGDMRELYDRLLPSQESMDRRRVFVKKLEDILHTEWPGNEFKVHVFGSSGNMLFTSESDVDVCIQTPMHKLEEMHMLAEALAKHGMEKVVCVPGAKVRIVKIWDPELNLACDMNVNNTLALENTRMIKTYVQVDERVRPLAMIIKYWTKQRILNDAALGGTISSYTWICMILNFLQTRDPPIVPSLHKLPYRKVVEETGELSSFADDLDKIRGFGKDNKETIGQLLFQFFRRYGHEIDYEKHVISVREGRLLTRAEKEWDVRSLKKEGRNRLCVEEPFNTERNLGNSADDFAWRGIHLEIRRAFDLLADGGQLDKACEQYEFPPEEKTVFKKPTPTVKPVLTSSVPTRGARGGSNTRGGRGTPSQRGNHAYQRRASSGASFGNNRPPFLHSPPLTAGPGPEYIVRGLNEQLHDQLFQQYQLLEMQSNSLRAQLAAQQRAQQAHQVQAAHMHAHAVAQAQAHAQQSRGQSNNGSPQKSPFINGQASPRLPEIGHSAGHMPHGFLYHYPAYYDPSQGIANSVSQDGPKTNPSSPSLTNSVPGLRRTVHRSSNASDTGSIRSQSQPARAGPHTTLVPGYPTFQYFDPATFAGYPIARSSQEPPTSQPLTEPPFSPLSGFPEPVASDHGVQKEYVGFFVEESPQIRPQLQDYSVPQIPSYSELAQRRSRVSPEVTQPLLNSALRRVSRSPSPLGGHIRSYSIGVTPPSGLKPQKERAEAIRPDDDGPVIANGSFSQPRESRSRSETLDIAGLESGNQLGIFVNSADQYRMEPRQQFLMEEMQRRQKASEMTPALANGSHHSVTPEGSNLSRVSSGKQPFPPLSDPWMNYESLNGSPHNHSSEVSPTRTQLPAWRATQFPNGLAPIDTMSAPRAPPQEIQSANLPLLSPVIETSTPSPTASRQLELSKQLNGTKGQAKENHSHSSRPAQSHTAPPTPVTKENRGSPTKTGPPSNDKLSKANSSTGHSQGSWQSQKKSKRNKKTNTHKNESKPQGQPLPANEADRKGG
jgi:DNA polymerase sigma